MMEANITKGYSPHWTARIREVFTPLPFLPTASYPKTAYPLSRLYPRPVQGCLFGNESSKVLGWGRMGKESKKQRIGWKKGLEISLRRWAMGWGRQRKVDMGQGRGRGVQQYVSYRFPMVSLIGPGKSRPEDDLGIHCTLVSLLFLLISKELKPITQLWRISINRCIVRSSH